MVVKLIVNVKNNNNNNKLYSLTKINKNLIKIQIISKCGSMKYKKKEKKWEKESDIFFSLVVAQSVEGVLGRCKAR